MRAPPPGYAATVSLRLWFVESPLLDAVRGLLHLQPLERPPADVGRGGVLGDVAFPASGQDLRPRRSGGLDTSGTTYTQADLDAIALKLNTRPRKTLGFLTPGAILAACVASTG